MPPHANGYLTNCSLGALTLGGRVALQMTHSFLRADGGDYRVVVCCFHERPCGAGFKGVRDAVGGPERFRNWVMRLAWLFGARGARPIVLRNVSWLLHASRMRPCATLAWRDLSCA